MSLFYDSVSTLINPPPGEVVTRAGVIPYSYVEIPDGFVEEYWLMGTLYSGRLSDFGGSCNRSQGETPYECILREVDEESNGLLTEAVRESLDLAYRQKDESVHVWVWQNNRQPNQVSYLVFAYVDYNQLADVAEQFEPNVENQAINWYQASEVLQQPVGQFNSNIQKFIRRFK